MGALNGAHQPGRHDTRVTLRLYECAEARQPGAPRAPYRCAIHARPTSAALPGFAPSLEQGLMSPGLRAYTDSGLLHGALTAVRQQRFSPLRFGASALSRQHHAFYLDSPK